MWKAGKLGAVHATGMPAPNRSHFAAMEAIAHAVPHYWAIDAWQQVIVQNVQGLLQPGSYSCIRGNDYPYANFLPSFPASAWYHKRLPADLQAMGGSVVQRLGPS